MFLVQGKGYTPTDHVATDSARTPLFVVSCGQFVVRQGLEDFQLSPSVQQPIRNVRLVPAGSDPLLEAADLIPECPAANIDGTVPVRIHTMRTYRPVVTR